MIAVSFGYEASAALCSALREGRPLAEGDPVSHDPQSGPWLRLPKTRKFMSKQDRLALSAATSAINGAPIKEQVLRERCGLFLVTGYIPFERSEAQLLAENSTDVSGNFSMQRASNAGYRCLNPLRAFSCLPNMPAHHIAANMGMHGEYMISYPDGPAFYGALLEARQRLREGSIDAALVGAVADQQNFLVQNHYAKSRAGAAAPAPDGAAFMLLVRKEDAAGDALKSGMAELLSLELTSQRAAPDTPQPDMELGALSLPMRLALRAGGGKGHFVHSESRGGRKCYSRWQLI